MEKEQAMPVKQRLLLERNDKSILGFWIYIMTDCVLFASLFASYAVLHTNTFGGPSGRNIFNLGYVFVETMVLLLSSFSCGMATIFAFRKNKKLTILFFVITILLGLTFLIMEISEFHHLAVIGDSWRRSAFLSAYFTLVGTHGLHITVGLIWMIIILGLILKQGLNSHNLRKITMVSIFWHFLDVVWIFIFSIVYLFGVIR